MKRSKHSLSHYRLTTFDMGELVPVGWYEALPGDTIQQSSAALLRCSPLNAPVMHPVSVRIHHWFVPNRLIMDDWEAFITGGSDGMDATVHPTITATPAAGDLFDYLGAPLGTSLAFNALPLRAYALVFNEFYRDADLVSALALSTASGADATTNTAVAKIAWEKDYLTAARPWAQKGPEVTLPLGTSAPVLRSTNAAAWQAIVAGTETGSPAGALNVGATSMLTDGTPNVVSLKPGTGSLYADLSGATAVDVNTVRRAFAVQRYEEARALYGSRYTEYLRFLGVRSGDARLQRPEYLGGGKQTIAFSEVLQTGPDSGDAGVADLKGHGIAAMRSRRYRRFFEEHGIVLTLMSVRPRVMYNDGVYRGWSRTDKTDYWQRELEKIGQQEILNKEAYAAAATPGGTFGYGDRYSEYRHLPSGVSGDFRSTFNYWHLARIFGAEPALNSSFVTCSPSKRVFADQVNDGLWVMVNHSIQARRMVSNNSIGRIV